MPAKEIVKVAMLAHTCYLTNPRVRREAEALAENGLEVHVISLSERFQGERGKLPDSLNGVQIHRLPINRRRGSFLRYFYEYFMTGVLGGLKLACLHFEGKISVVHIHNMPDLLVLAAVVPRIGGSRLVLDVHDPMPELYMSRGHRRRSVLVRLLRLQEKLSCWLADRVISVNDTMRENLVAKGVAEDKIAIIHNYPDANHFPVRNMPVSWPRRADSLVLLYCGTVTEHYDLELAVRAMAAVASEVPVRLRILGEGNKLQEVLNLASTLGLRDSIDLVGKVPIENVADEMRRADVGISCHRSGVFGDLYFSTKIIEYLTQGLCVVTSRTYTIGRYLCGDCVFFFDAGNAAAFADAIRFVWRHPAEVLKRLNRSRQLLSHLSWQTERGKLLDLYLSLQGVKALDCASNKQPH